MTSAPVSVEKIRSYIWVNVAVILCLFANLYLFGVPQPGIHDEFSYLLGGDTFANGRLSNPEHQHKDFFHTFHVLQSPVYASKYPPGSFLFLAIGFWLGHPYFGIWIQAILFANVMLWFALTFLPNKWALGAAVAALIQFCLANYWTISYWGGLTAAIAGCLALGGYWRVLWPPYPSKKYNAALCGIGLVLLMATRPFEGLIITGVSFPLFMGMKLLRKTNTISSLFNRFWITGIFVLLGMSFIFFYNYKTTGSMTSFPHSEYAKQYFETSLFGGEKTDEFEVISVGQFQSFHDLYLVPAKSNYNIEDGLRKKSDTIFDFYFFHKLGLLVVAGLPLVWNFKTQFFVIPTVLAWLAESILISFHPHYIAPLAASLVVFQFTCLRALLTLLPVYRSQLRVFITVCCIIYAFIAKERIQSPTYVNTAFWQFSHDRSQIIAKVLEYSDYNCIFVNYIDSGMHHMEWVFNLANVDQQNVIWAHDLGEKNSELLAYYPNRTFWRLNISRKGLDLEKF